MPTSFVTQTRTAVIAAITTSGLTPTAPVIGLYDVRFNLADLKNGRIVVMPADKHIQRESRGSKTAQHDVMIDVAVQYKFTTPSQAEIDPWMNLAETLIDYFDGMVLSNNFTCISGEFRHLFIPKLIEDFRAFTSVITLTFRAIVNNGD